MKVKYLSMAFALLSSSSPILAAPSITSISGRVVELSTITITGADFGSHANFNGTSHNRPSFLATVFKDMEDATLVSDRMTVSGEEDNWSVGASTPRTNSSYYGHRFYSDNRNAPMAHTQVATATTGEYYMSAWFRTPDQANNCGSKNFRLYYGTHSSIDNFYLVTGCTGGTFDNWHVRGFSESAGTPSPNTVFDSTGTQYQNDVWHFLEVWASTNTGEVTVWLDGTRHWTRRTSCGGLSSCEDEEWIDASGWNPGGNRIGFAWEAQSLSVCNANCPGHSVGGQFDFDDMYISYTRAHVVICSGSTWATRGTCEFQIPLTWNSAEITLSTNVGAFSNGTQVYAYVVTESGVTDSEDVNANGYPLVTGDYVGGTFEADTDLTALGYECLCVQ